MPQATNNLSRRKLMIASAAAAGVVAVPIAAVADPAAPDAIFELIEAHRQAARAYTAAVLATSRVSDALPMERQHWCWTVDAPEVPANCTDAPEWIEAQVALSRAADALEDARFEVLTSVPTTLAGVAAVLDHAALPAFPDESDLGRHSDTILENAFGNVYEGIGDIGDNFLTGMAEAVRRLTTPAVAGAAAAPVVPSRSIAKADPIFAVIAGHRAAVEAALKAGAEAGALSLSDPLEASMSALSKAAWDRASEAVYLVFTERPTTLTGAVALLRHVGSPEFLDYDEPSGQTVLESELGATDDKMSGAAGTFLARLAATMTELTVSAA
jgi:hypothetical protein